jgi:hypothetical protein
MQLIAQKMAARRHIAAAEAAPSAAHTAAGGPVDDDGQAAGPGVDFGATFGLMLRATTALEAATSAMRRGRSTGWEHVHPVEIPPGPQVTKPIPAGAPAATTTYYAEPDTWGPQSGWVWRINGWTIQLGTAATGFSVWYDSPGDPTNLIFSSTVSARWEPDRLYLMPERQIVFTGNGGPLIICKGAAEEIAVDFLPHYLAGSVARFV